MWDMFQGLGALAGLISALYLAFRHVTRTYPVAIIVARKHYDLNKELFPFIRIKNSSERPLIVTFKDNTALNELRVMGDYETRSVIAAAMRAPTRVIIDGEATAEFPIASRKDIDTIDPENMMVVRFYCRFAQPHWWQRERMYEIRIRKREMKALTEGLHHGLGDEE